jgi:hypothetical protein
MMNDLNINIGWLICCCVTMILVFVGSYVSIFMIVKNLIIIIKNIIKTIFK